MHAAGEATCNLTSYTCRVIVLLHSQIHVDYVFFRPKMSRTLRKAVETAKQKKETEINLTDEGIAHLAEVPELCELETCVWVLGQLL